MDQNAETADLIGRYVSLLQRISLSDRQAAAMAGEMRAYWHLFDGRRARLGPVDQPADFAATLASLGKPAGRENSDDPAS
jgi:hypothetical protein